MAEPANDQLDEEEVEPEQRQRFRHFLLDYGYAPGERFCRELLGSGEFSSALLGHFCDVGFKNLPKEQLAAHVAARLMNGEVNADDLMLAFCQQPRDWLCLRLGNKVNLWPQKGTAQQFLTERDKSRNLIWYGPFGTGDERWYVVAKNVEQIVSVGDGWGKFDMRWHVMVQVNERFVALHWFNASVHEKPNQRNHPHFAFWHYINDIYAQLNSFIRGTWDPEEPNLAWLILRDVVEKYTEHPQYKLEHKAVRSMFDSVALNASGGSKLMKGSTPAQPNASGLEIMTRDFAETAAAALGKTDEESIQKVDRALLRKILRGQGTKSYEFTLDERPTAESPTKKPVARMRVSFGVDSPQGGKQTPDTIQHVHTFQKYGRSTKALKFILSELGMDATSTDEDPPYEEDSYWDDDR